MICIIDGYNVMYALEGGDTIAAADLEEKRRRFIEMVVSYTAMSGDDVTIVFDSTVSSTPQTQEIPGSSVTIVFGSASESADILIGKLVQQRLAKGEERIQVVSADWEVQKGVMQSRVERIPPRHYLGEIERFDKDFTNGLVKADEMGRIRWKLEHRLDVETLEKLERMRRGDDENSPE